MIPYVSLATIKSELNISGTANDEKLSRILFSVSRMIDNFTGRTWLPERKTVYLDGMGGRRVIFPDYLLEIDSFEMSQDYGDSYTAIAATDYDLRNPRDEYEPPYFVATISPNGDYSHFYAGRKSLKLTGIWGFHTDPDDAWLDSTDEVVSSPLTAGATTLTVQDADGLDFWGFESRFHERQIIRINDEFIYIRSIDTGTDALTIARAVQGSTAAEHTAGTTIKVWSPPKVIQRATMIQAIRSWQRSKQAYADTSANPDMGRMFYSKSLDPEVELMLVNSGLKKVSVG